MRQNDFVGGVVHLEFDAKERYERGSSGGVSSCGGSSMTQLAGGNGQKAIDQAVWTAVRPIPRDHGERIILKGDYRACGCSKRFHSRHVDTGRMQVSGGEVER